MKERGKLQARRHVFAITALGILISIGIAGCSSPKPVEQEQGPKRYSLNGRVVSIDKGKLEVVVDADDIPGFMAAMKMGYAVKNASLLDSLSPEDQIKADVVVNKDDVWLENIVVAKKGDQTKAPAKQ